MRRLIKLLFGLGTALLVQLLPAPAQQLPLGSAGHCASRDGKASPQQSHFSCRTFHLAQGVTSECMAACQRALASQNYNLIMQYCNSCDQGGGPPPQSYGEHCGHGAYCPQGTSCCGMQCCNAGYQCSSAGCIPQGAADCGNGQYCQPGTMCWRAPASIGGIRRGTISCVTSEQANQLEGEIAIERERAAARKRWEEEQRKADAKKAEEKKKEAARRKQEEQARAAAEAKLKATAGGRQKVSELLKQGQDTQREAELKKAAQANQQQWQRALASTQQKTTGQKLCDFAFDANSADWKNCMIREQPRPSAPVQTAPPTDPDWARKQLEALARDETTSKSPAPTAQGPLTKQQYDFLKQNAAGLQPEQRKVDQVPAPRAASPPSATSTFLCGNPPNQYPCPTEIGRSAPTTNPTPPAPGRNPFFESTPEAAARAREVERERARAETEALIRRAREPEVERQVEIPTWQPCGSVAAGWGWQHKICDRRRRCEAGTACTEWENFNCAPEVRCR